MSVRKSLSITALACGLVACGGSNEERARAGKTGRVSLPLTAVSAGGTSYRLAPAEFRVFGSGVDLTFDASGMDTLDFQLDPGTYEVRLKSGWALSREGPTGPTPVNAVLQSPNPQTFLIEDGGITDLYFDFGVGPDAVAFGKGIGRVHINVDDGCQLETYYLDYDQDGFGDPLTAMQLCAPPADSVTVGGDCDDYDDHVNPGAPELCDGRDNNCDDAVDEGESCVKRVFVSEDIFLPVFDSAASVDALCTGMASGAGLGGDWMAWISFDDSAAADRFNGYIQSVERVDGVQVLSELADLVNGLQAPINVTENGTALTSSEVVWTGSTDNGVRTDNCDNWAGTGVGRFGSTDQTDYRWSVSLQAPCSLSGRIYCFEQ